MTFLTSWLSKKEPEDYEQVLSSLALDIQKRQTRLSEIRLRERRTTLLLTLYSFAFWGLYIALWYGNFLPKSSRQPSASNLGKILRGLPVLVGPILIQLSRRIVQTWYTRIGNAEEKTLKALYAKQRSKVEEIKKKTNYYSTKNLIERYDESPGKSPARPPQLQPLAAPLSPVPTPSQANGKPNGQSPISAAPSQISSVSSLPQTPVQLQRRQWYDKIADALLGDDELSSANSPSNRYALICQKCFGHNGLVTESLWQETQYVCPKCGHFNPSPRSLRSGARNVSGLSPDRSISPQPRSHQPQGPHIHSTPSPPQGGRVGNTALAPAVPTELSGLSPPRSTPSPQPCTVKQGGEGVETEQGEGEKNFIAVMDVDS